MAKKSLPNQLCFQNPLELSLREAFEKYHRQTDHSRGHLIQLNAALAHWERCTDNPPIGTIDNAVMHAFRNRFLTEPLPSKVERLFHRPRRTDPATIKLLDQLGLKASELVQLVPSTRYQVIRDQFMEREPLLPTIRQRLLPASPSFNSVRAGLEGILSTLGPSTDRHPFSLGLLSSVPRCRPAAEDEPSVVVATEEDLAAIYEACSVATWPREQETCVPAPNVWRALLVYLYNVASRRGDFLSLRKDQVQLNGGCGGWGVFLKTQGKTGKTRPVPLHPVVVAHLRPLWESNSELAFPFPLNGELLYGTWRMIQRTAGIKVQRSPGSERHNVFGFHEIRKTSLGEYFDVDERASQMMGAHSSMQTQLRHYIAAQKKDGVLRRAAEALPQPDAFCTKREEPTPPAPSPAPSDRPRFRIVG